MEPVSTQAIAARLGLRYAFWIFCSERRAEAGPAYFNARDEHHRAVAERIYKAAEQREYRARYLYISERLRHFNRNREWLVLQAIEINGPIRDQTTRQRVYNQRLKDVKKFRELALSLHIDLTPLVGLPTDEPLSRIAEAEVDARWEAACAIPEVQALALLDEMAREAAPTYINNKKAWTNVAR